MSLRTFVEDDGVRLKQLLSELRAGRFRFPKVHPAEISNELLETLGFRPAGGQFYAGKARAISRAEKRTLQWKRRVYVASNRPTFPIRRGASKSGLQRN